MADIIIPVGNPVNDVLDRLKGFIEQRSDNPFKQVLPSLLVDKVITPVLCFGVTGEVRSLPERVEAQVGFSVICSSPNPELAGEECTRLTRWLLLALTLAPKDVIEIIGFENLPISYYWSSKPISPESADDAPDEGEDVPVYMSAFSLTVPLTESL